ncbi:porin [Gallaecimonas mangrovi]|uniref:porin n=1 Tax=Gallaecimonas mangrovi TaxID=2291597 RepID=UPI000E2090CD|nr:porin [Gallaecimonas mangrovi]
MKPAILASSLLLIGIQPALADIKVGGAFRLNYAWKDYDQQNKDENGEWDIELFRLDINGDQGKWFYSAQYRWYQGFEAVHHAYVGYHFDANRNIKVGVTKVPFGLLPVSSHSFWFGGTYYLGMEDDYDTGIVYQQKDGDWLFHAAYFKNAEYQSGDRYDRYSFDLAAVDGERADENGQINLRAERTLHFNGSQLKLGASGQFGRLYRYNSQTDDNRWAAALHAQWDLDSGWQWQLQEAHYKYDTGTDTVELSAFQYPFPVASEADVVSLNVAKKFTVNNDFVDTVTCYNDHTETLASGEGVDNSIQNVTGCLLVKGGLYTYIDWIAGKNMWFAGGDGIGVASPDNDGWHSRLNINIGFYF